MRRFAHSQQLDPQLGTLFNLATCNAHLGKLATAWGQFHDVAQRDTNRTRRAKATSEAAALAPRLPRLVIKLDPAVADATITSNGVDVSALLGIESPVDLGDYVIVARASGYAESRITAKITSEGKTVVVALALARPPSLDPPRPTAPAPPRPTAPPQLAPPPVTPPTEPLPPAAPRDQPAAPGRSTLGIVALAGGGALIAGGVVFGKLASDKWSGAKAVCGPDVECASAADLSRARALTDQARVRGNVSTGLIVAGVAAAGAGAYLWLRAPTPAQAMSARLVPNAGPTGAGIVLEGWF